MRGLSDCRSEPYFLRFVLLTGFAVAVQKHSEQLRQLGGFLVIVGVAGELWIEIRASRVETDLREETNEVIARAEERAAEALKAAAEANLARAKIEQRMRPRILGADDQQALKDLLTAHSKLHIDTIVFDHHIAETLRFADQIFSIFASAVWRVRQWESRQVTYRIPGPSVLIALAEGHVTNESMDVAEKLAAALTALDIDCGISPGAFGCKGEYTPGAFQIRFQKPTVIMGGASVAPFRIQIGAKQLSALPPSKVVRVVPKAPK